MVLSEFIGCQSIKYFFFLRYRDFTGYNRQGYAGIKVRLKEAEKTGEHVSQKIHDNE